MSAHEQGILNIAIHDRIQSLLQELRGNTPKEKFEDMMKIDKAALDAYRSLPEEQRLLLLKAYMQDLEKKDDAQKALYKGGVIDGIKIMKYLQTL